MPRSKSCRLSPPSWKPSASAGWSTCPGFARGQRRRLRQRHIDCHALWPASGPQQAAAPTGLGCADERTLRRAKAARRHQRWRPRQRAQSPGDPRHRRRLKSSPRPLDDQGRFDSDHLPPLDDRTLLILQAGNVNSGAFDPFSAALPCSARSRRLGPHRRRLWLVGARLPLHGAADRRHRTGRLLVSRRAQDAEQPLRLRHHPLSRPPGSGQRLQASDDYLHFGGGRDGMLYTPEMSRRARGIELWAALKSLGRSGVDQLVAQLCQRARQFAAELDAQPLPHSQ